jgi:hypothetical protein
VSHSIFALELCVRLDEVGLLHHHLRQALPVQLAQMSPGQKWQQYHRAAQLLRQHIGAAERGCWDYFDDEERARNDFEMWTKGMTTAEGAREGSRPIVPGEPRYLTFTMAFLLLKDSPSDLALRQACRIKETHLWRRDVFAHLLESFGAVSFSSVYRDVAYLIPRDVEFALTAQDLTAQKFEYLRTIVDKQRG